MKYKVTKGTPLFDQLKELEQKLISADRIAKDLVIELGGDAHSAGMWDTAAGGITGIRFKEKPDGWKQVGETWQRLYMPKANKANAELIKRIDALPRVKSYEIRNLLNFERQSTPNKGGFGMIMHECPGVQFGKDMVIVAINEECKYEPVEGMKEILVSEYKLLLDMLKTENNESTEN